MAKKRKKKNYRLRKSVRRTLGALFMISAIIIAAIPFPDAAATDGVPPQESEPPVETRAELPKPQYETVSDNSINQSVNLNNANNQTPIKAYTVKESGGKLKREVKYCR